MLDFEDAQFDESFPQDAQVLPQNPEPVSQVEEKQGDCPAPKASYFDIVGPCSDPLDRSVDRAMAPLGLIEDADPLFAPGERIDCLGFFVVIALLDQNPLLDIFAQVYGKTLAPAFYGLRTTVMTLLMMAMLRIKRPEHLRQIQPGQI